MTLAVVITNPAWGGKAGIGGGHLKKMYFFKKNGL
jgi:hypothetical protein